MNYVESFNLLGIDAKQIPCIKGEGAPTTSTEGAVGCFYMDTLTGDIYINIGGDTPWRYSLEYIEQSFKDLSNEEILLDDIWEAGAINDKGIDTNAIKRLRTKRYIQLRKGDTITTKKSREIGVYEYDLANFAFIVKTADWVTNSTYTVQNDCFVRLMVFWNETDSYETVNSEITITRNSPKELYLGALPMKKIHEIVEEPKIIANKAKTIAEEAKTIAEENKIEKSPSRNLLNVTWENLDINNGEIVPANGDKKRVAFADYIPVIGGENYTLSWIKNDKKVYIYLHEYREDKSYIKFTNLTATNEKSVITKQLDASCAFVRMDLWNSDKTPLETWEENIPENFQMELGTEATTYVKPLSIDTEQIDDVALAAKMRINGAFDIDEVALADQMRESGALFRDDLAFEKLQKNETLTADSWERGGLNSTDGLENNSVYYRTKGYIQLRKGDEVKTGSFSVFEYDPITLKFLCKNDGWVSSYILQNDCYARILHWASANSNPPSNVVIVRNTQDRLKLEALPLEKVQGIAERISERIANENVDKVAKGYISDVKFVASQNSLFKQIAHRGFRGTGAPQCTAPAYIEAKKFGYIAGENDLQITTDGIFVMAHDVTLPSDSSIIVNKSTYQTLINGNMGTFKGKEVDIMTFEEWLILMKKIGLEPYVDLKSGLDVDQAKDVIAIVRKHGLLDKVTWSGSKGSAVNLRAAYANARIALLYSDELPNFDSLEDLIIEGHPELTVLYMKSTSVDEAFMTEAINKGFSVECWHCDYSANGFTTEEAILGEVERVLELGVTGICLDTYLPCEYFINKMNAEWGLN